MEDWLFFDYMRVIVLWTSPVAFVMGIIIMFYRNYRHLETLAAKEFGLRKRILPKIEQNIYTFHEWCLQKRTWLGLACIIYALVVFLLLRRYDSLGDVIEEIY